MIAVDESQLPPREWLHAPVAIEIVDDERGLEAMRAEWDALVAACHRPSPCATHAWATAWWRAFGNRADGAGRDTQPFVVVLRDAGGRLVGVVPFVEDRPASPLRVRRLRALGFVGQDGVFDMTEEPSLLVMEGWEARTLAALATALRPGLQAGRWDSVHLRVLAEAAARPLQDALSATRGQASVRIDVRGGSDYATLPGSWGDYRKAMTRSMRDNLPYYPRLLSRDGHDWRVRTLTEPGDMADAAARLAALHRARAASAKGKRHDAHVHGPVQEAFLSDLLCRLAARGEARVAELVVDGRVVASQAFLEAGDTMTVYYSGYEEAWSKYSPIFVIDAVVFRDALERGVRRLDFLRSPAPWKARWLAEPGPCLHRATLVSRRPASHLRYGLFWTGQALRRNVRDRLPILARQGGDLWRGVRPALERALWPAFPVLSRLGPRLAPTLHWALVQAPLHHR